MPKSRTAALLLALSLAGLPELAMASPPPIFDGHALKDACADGDAYYTYGKCAGFIIGAHDQYVLAVGADATICVPLEDGNTPDGLIEPVADYLARNGKRLAEPASALVVAALEELFPCRQE